MAVSDGVTIIGQYQVVVMNRGARDGLAPGNVLAVFEVGGTGARHGQQGLSRRDSTLSAKNVRLPDERSGTFMVFKTFDRMSYGLIMEAKNVIRVADKVENPCSVDRRRTAAQISASAQVLRGAARAAACAIIRRMRLSDEILAWVVLARAPALDASSALARRSSLGESRPPSAPFGCGAAPRARIPAAAREYLASSCAPPPARAERRWLEARAPPPRAVHRSPLPEAAAARRRPPDRAVRRGQHGRPRAIRNWRSSAAAIRPAGP